MPEKYAKLLNTDFYQYLIPPLYSQYPNSNMSAEVYATQQPQVAFIKGGFFTNIVGQVSPFCAIYVPLQLDIYVLQPTNTEVLSLGVLVDSQMEVDVDNNVILAKLDALACNFTLIKSTIGDVRSLILCNSFGSSNLKFLENFYKRRVRLLFHLSSMSCLRNLHFPFQVMMGLV